MAPAASFTLRNALVVLPAEVERRSVVVRDGHIRQIAAADSAGGIDCETDYLLPGLIEVHTDNLERHIEPRPGTFWNVDHAVLAHDAELAAAGITTVLDAITVGGDIGEHARERAHLEAITSIQSAQAQGLLRSEHYLHLRCELGSPRLAEDLHRAFHTCAPRLVSLMEHVPGQGQWRNIPRFRQYYGKRYGLSGAQLDALIERRRSDQARFAAGNRDRALQLARRVGCVVASHDDACDGDIERAAVYGCRIAEFPTSMAAARAARGAGMQVVAGAPNLLRGGSHSGNVAASELASEGLIDILSSDYYPSSLLRAVFWLVHETSMPLHEAVALAADNPARALGLSDRGAIREGLRADLVRVRDTARGPIVIAAWCGGRQVA